MLLFLQPCFFVDVSEAWVYANRWQRVAIVVAGIWVELIFCALATVVWWGTASGSYAHELAYKVILITGVAVVVLNLNPLIKLDGYYLLCELLDVTEIKERSTAFVSGWTKREIFGLPVTYDYVNPRRAWLYILYAVTSGVYSYLLLLAVSRFAYNVMRGFYPEWAFIPALGLLYLLFRSRLRNLVTFMRTLYFDKKERLWAWFTVPRLVLISVAVATILFAPFWRESIEGRFALEPGQRAVVRAEVPGQVAQVFVTEGSPVTVGAPVARLQNLDLESRAARIQAEAQIAAANATQAQLKYSSFGPAEREKEQLAQQSRSLGEEKDKLNLVSPVAGIVTTPRVRDLLGSSLKAGTPVVEITDLSQMQARIYVPEAVLQHVVSGAQAVVQLDAYLSSIPGRVTSIAPASTEIEPGLVHKEDYRGLHTSTYYVATVMVPNNGQELFEGMSGTAKIFSAHRSLASLAWRAVREFLGRKLW
jgi:putative peptide zinc metalloprotease protein